MPELARLTGQKALEHLRHVPAIGDRHRSKGDRGDDSGDSQQSHQTPTWLRFVCMPISAPESDPWQQEQNARGYKLEHHVVTSTDDLQPLGAARIIVCKLIGPSDLLRQRCHARKTRGPKYIKQLAWVQASLVVSFESIDESMSHCMGTQ